MYIYIYVYIKNYIYIYIYVIYQHIYIYIMVCCSSTLLERYCYACRHSWCTNGTLTGGNTTINDAKGSHDSEPSHRVVWSPLYLQETVLEAKL